MLALAAVLWFVYLVPSWVRRREYLATERNATRLQRTIRVMAESAEAPQEIQLEVAARDAAQQEKLLREEQRRADAQARAELRAAAARARLAEARAAEVDRAARAAEADASRRLASAAPLALDSAASTRTGLRRARRVAGLLMLAALAVAVVQVALMVSGGAVLGSWLVLAGCATGAVVSANLQQRIAARSRGLAAPRTASVARRASVSTLIDPEPIAQPSREWTPVPVPKPLYVQHQEPPREPVAPRLTSGALLRAAAEEAERALAAAHAEPEVVKFPVRQAEPAAAAPAAPVPSRFASMGVVDAGSAQLDLDEILQRRRSG